MNFNFEIKSVQEGGTFKGLASTWELDRHGDVIETGAFAKTLADWQKRGARIPILWAHQHDEPVGAIVTATETAEGLEIEGQLALDVGNAKRAYSLAKTGALAMSIGFTVPEGGADIRSGVRFIKQIDLAEISLVAIPANPGAVVREVKSARDCTTIREFENLARDALGLSAREAKKVAAASWPELHRDGAKQPRDVAPKYDVTAIRKALGLPSIKPI